MSIGSGPTDSETGMETGLEMEVESVNAASPVGGFQSDDAQSGSQDSAASESDVSPLDSSDESETDVDPNPLTETGRIAQIEAESEDPVNDSAEYLAEKVPGEGPDGLQSAVDVGTDEEDASQTEIQQIVTKAIQEILQQKTEEIVSILESGDQDKAKQELQAILTPGVQLEDETLTSDRVAEILNTHMDKQLILRQIVLLSKALDSLAQARRVSGDASEGEDEPVSESADLKSKLVEEAPADDHYRWIKALADYNQTLEKTIDSADVPSLLRAIFAIEQYGSSRSAFEKGMEAPKENLEQSTLKAFTSVFSQEATARTFLLVLLEKSDEDFSQVDVRGEVNALLETPDENETRKQEKILLIKERMIRAFKACENTYPSLRGLKAENLNLSPVNMQFFLLQTERVANRRSKPLEGKKADNNSLNSPK